MKNQFSSARPDHKTKSGGRGLRGENRGGRGPRGARNTVRPGYEGGQPPLHQRLPRYRGIQNLFAKEYAIINLSQLDAAFEADSIVTPELLLERGVVRDLKEGVKVLGDGEITKPLTVVAHKFSKSALEKIQATGGCAEILDPSLQTWKAEPLPQDAKTTPEHESGSAASPTTGFRGAADIFSLGSTLLELLRTVPEGRTASEAVDWLKVDSDEVSAALGQLVGEGRVMVEEERFRIAGTAAPKATPDATTALLLRYAGQIDLFEDDTAFLTLQDPEGRVFDAEYPAEQLRALHLAEGHRFQCEFLRTPTGVELRFQPLPDRELTAEERSMLAARWEPFADAL